MPTSHITPSRLRRAALLGAAIAAVAAPAAAAAMPEGPPPEAGLTSKEPGDMPPPAWAEAPFGELWLPALGYSCWPLPSSPRNCRHWWSSLPPMSTEGNAVKVGDRLTWHFGFAPVEPLRVYILVPNPAGPAYLPIPMPGSPVEVPAGGESTTWVVPPELNGPIRLWIHASLGNVFSEVNGSMSYGLDLVVQPAPTAPVIDGDPPNYPDGADLIQSVGAPPPTATPPPPQASPPAPSASPVRASAAECATWAARAASAQRRASVLYRVATRLRRPAARRAAYGAVAARLRSRDGFLSLRSNC